MPVQYYLHCLHEEREAVGSTESYEGWKNRETWAIQLHLANTEGDYTAMREKAIEFVRENDGDRFDAIEDMAAFIKNWTEEVFETVLWSFEGNFPGGAERGFVADVGSHWRADFYEIAEHWIDEAREELGIDSMPIVNETPA